MAIEKTFLPRLRVPQLRTLAGFILLDAIIGNTDRHHDNWGLLLGPSADGKVMHEIAPSFDHASSLGRELRDERRKAILDQNALERYILRARGGIYWEDTDSKGDNPLRLATKAAQAYPEYFHPWIQKLEKIQS